MYFDLHCHSVASDDARGTVAQYAKWIASLRKKGFTVDGLVLTEHRGFNPALDYSAIADEYELQIYQATELDTDTGHFLLFGVNPELQRAFDFKNVRIDAVELVRIADETGAVAVPAHPGRERVSFIDLAGERDFSLVRAVELHNGGSKDWENERAARLVTERGYAGLGGSDAHFVNSIAKVLTRIDARVQSLDDIISAIKDGRCAPVLLEETAARVVAT
jgi:predicted metal-dependent phosphoesterase TrpH